MISSRRGGGIVIEATCFENNKVNNIGPAVSYRLDTQVVPQVTNTYADTDTADGTCGVLSDVIVESLSDLTTAVSATCVAADANVCSSSAPISTPSPMVAPTSIPVMDTSQPTSLPPTASVSPSSLPTISQFPTTSLAPSRMPTVSYRTCYIGMILADIDSNFRMTETEYVKFVNRQSGNGFYGMDFNSLPSVLQDNFRANFVSPTDNVFDIQGSRPGDTPSDMQRTELEKICQDTDIAIRKALESASPSSTPSQSPSSTPSQSPSGITMQRVQGVSASPPSFKSMSAVVTAVILLACLAM